MPVSYPLPRMVIPPLRLLSLILLAFLSACTLINPREAIPTYIQIDSANVVSTVPVVHGSVSKKIKDIWVYYNRQLLGAFPLPAKVPVLASGKGELELVAGIWDNGLSGTRAKYPFYNIDTFAFDASPAGIIHHNPQFTYNTTNASYFVEDFEQGNSFEKFSGDTTLVKTNLGAEVFEGGWSGKIYLHDTISEAQVATVQSFTLPYNRMSYLELNYKNDMPFVIQTQIIEGGVGTLTDLIGVNTSSNWNKIYVNVGSYAAAHPSAVFKFLIQTVLPSGQTQGTVLLDNFKILHFN